MNKLTVVNPLTLSSAQIDETISNIQIRGAKLDADIQSCALSILLRIETDGDYTKANMLFAAMPRGSRRNALVEWFISFGKVKLSTESDKNKVPFVFAKKKTTDMEGAMAKAWYLCKPEMPVELAFDLEAQLIALLNRAAKAKEAGKEIKTGKVDFTLLSKMVA